MLQALFNMFGSFQVQQSQQYCEFNSPYCTHRRSPYTTTDDDENNAHYAAAATNQIPHEYTAPIDAYNGVMTHHLVNIHVEGQFVPGEPRDVQAHERQHALGLEFGLGHVHDWNQQHQHPAGAGAEGLVNNVGQDHVTAAAYGGPITDDGPTHQDGPLDYFEFQEFVDEDAFENNVGPIEVDIPTPPATDPTPTPAPAAASPAPVHFRCNVCGSNRCTSPHSLQRHMHRKHNGPVPEYRCTSCDYTTEKATDLPRHYLSIHAEGIARNAYSCPHCGRGFPRKDNTKRHISHVHRSNAAAVAVA